MVESVGEKKTGLSRILTTIFKYLNTRPMVLSEEAKEILNDPERSKVLFEEISEERRQIKRGDLGEEENGHEKDFILRRVGEVRRGRS